jgi:intracellular septation protein
MSLLVDLLPVIAFFAAFYLGKSFPAETGSLVSSIAGPVASSAAFPELAAVLFATGVAIVATVLQVGWLLARRRKVKPMLWLSAFLIIGFGSLTIVLQNEWFIKWKPSVLYWMFALVLAGGRLFGRNLLGLVLGDEVKLPAAVWERLLWMWTGFFAVLGAVNLFVAYRYTTEQWVNFKTFGLLGLTLAFSLACGFYIARHLHEAADG